MAEIRAGELIRNETNQNSKGGTELMLEGLHSRMDQNELKDFQIVASRKRELSDDLIRIFWAHDLPGDPESAFLEDRANHDLFHLYVFVSNWQMQGYINRYGLPWSKCVVVENAIVPLKNEPRNTDEIRLIYTPTPHRGLEILVPVFEELCKTHDNIYLDVFSSFELYGWKQRDLQYRELFDRIRNHDKMVFHGTCSNDLVRNALESAHIFAYPSIWQETSCLCLMEAMSAGLVCVHSNLGALYETANKLTTMYQFNEDPQKHATTFYHLLNHVIENYDHQVRKSNGDLTSMMANRFFDWKLRELEWKIVFRMLKNRVKTRSLPKQSFEYNT